MPEDVTYLNCANMSPQLKTVTSAGLEAVRIKSTPWTLSSREWFSGAESLRSLAAQLFGCDLDGIALVPAASYGIATAAANVPLRAGQTIVLLEHEFPSNVYAWRTLAEKQGGTVVTVVREQGESWTSALLRHINERTAVVAASPCHWTDGGRVDLEVVGQRARAVGASLVVDASQCLGATVLDIARIQPDFLVSVGYKWLLGPYGLGYLYVAPKWRENGVPLEQSWMTRAGSDDFASLVEYTDEYQPGARRFDMGEFPQFISVPMAAEALKQILAWGVPYIQETLGGLTANIARQARQLGYSVAPGDQRIGHIIGIRTAHAIPAALAEALTRRKIYVSIRGDAIRIAPHLYNSSADIDRLFAVLHESRA